MGHGSMRRAMLGVGYAVLAILLQSAPAGAQVTYQVGTPPPGAPPPIDNPPAAAPADPAPPPVPPATVGAAPDPAPADPSTAPAVAHPATAADKPDVNNPVKQTGQVVKDIAKGDVKALREGPLLIHGNYCGIGNRPGTEPTDALDEACMHHDACTTEGKLPNCACDNHLKSEAMRIAQDPRTPPKIQVLAATMAASMAILICK